MNTMVFVSAGIFVGVFVSIILIKGLNTNNKFKTDYDERQEAVRGRGYKYAAYTAWGLMVVLFVMSMGNVKLPIDDALLYFTVMIISLMVQVCHAVWNDAYFGSNNERNKYLIFFVILVLINGGAAIGYYRDGSLIVDGILTFRGANAECALIFIIMGIELVMKNLFHKEEIEEE